MKLKIFFLFLVVTVASSCKKLLEPNPNLTGTALSINAYTDYTGALQGINGIYSTLRSNYLNNYYLDELSDDSYAGTNRTNIDDNKLGQNSGEAATSFGQAYITISRINIFLERVPKIKGLNVNQEILTKQFIGEAKVLRALMYFNLVRLFGSVPLVLTEQTDPKKLQVPKVAANLVYDQIIKDLTEAIPDLPAVHPTNKLVDPVPASLLGGREKGRVTSILAKSILGDVYLTLKDFPKADVILSEALADAAANNVDLNSNFNDNFEALSGKELSSEVLFDIGFNTAVSQHNYGYLFGPPEDTGVGLDYSAPTDNTLPLNLTLNNTLAEAFVAGDKRKASTIKYNYIEFPTTTTTNRSINAKYWEKGKSNNSVGNIIVYRLADVILLAAEAKQALGGAQDGPALALLNRVHAHPRTGLTAYVGLAGIPLRDAIRSERRVELALECKRYYDLLRWGTLGAVMTAHGLPVDPVKNGLLPIPRGEIEKNPNLLPQNPGY